MSHIKAYGVFLAMYIITKVVVAPAVNKMNLPVIGGVL